MRKFVRIFHWPVSPLAVAALLISTAQPTFSAERWQEAGSGAVAILPAPEKADIITGGSLHCAEQRWGLLFRLAPGTVASGVKLPAKLVVAGAPFSGEAEEKGGALAFAVPREVLEPLKQGTRMAFTAGEGTDALAAVFPLAASRKVIETIAPKCSQIDMSAYAPVTLSETDAGLADAKELLDDEARLFRGATGRQPVFASRIVPVDDGNRLMFASLCGSTSYYGESGCTLRGFASDPASPQWKPVYNTEGLLLFLDKRLSNGGWPSLVTLPVVNGEQPDHWVWTGEAYELRETVISQDGSAEEAPDPAQP